MSNFEVRFYYCQRWLGPFGRTGIAVGRWVFFRWPFWMVTDRLLDHETEHCKQYDRLRLLGQWWVAIPAFWAAYACQWVAAGFRWRRIRYEVEARRAEKQG